MSLAFFDFDNTLIDGDAGPLFGRHLYRKHAHRRGRLRAGLRYVPFAMWMSIQAALYRIGAVKRSTIVRNAYRGLKGVPVDRFDAEVDHFVDTEIAARILPSMRAEVERHLAAKRRCLVVTTGMEALVTRALRHFPDGIDVIGCVLEERRGRFTGKVTGPLFGADKANIMTAYARALGVPLSECWAYTDHYSDVHMLEAVGHPACVGPRGRLRKLAQARGWRIIERQA